MHMYMYTYNYINTETEYPWMDTPETSKSGYF